MKMEKSNSMISLLSKVDKIKRKLKSANRKHLMIGAASFVFFVYSVFFIIQCYKDTRGVELYGNIDVREVDLGFRVSGKLEDVLVQEGDFVKSGEVLAKLDKAPFLQDLAMSQANYSVNKAAVGNAEINFNMVDDLFKMKVKSKYEHANALMQIEQARANLEYSKAKLEASKITLEDTTLLSPSDGIIVSRAYEKGSIINATSRILTLALVSELYAKGYVNERVLGKIKIGDRAHVLTDSGTKFESSIIYISPNAEFTPKTIETRELRTDLVYKVHFKVVNHGNLLHKGMPVTVNIKYSDNK